MLDRKPKTLNGSLVHRPSAQVGSFDAGIKDVHIACIVGLMPRFWPREVVGLQIEVPVAPQAVADGYAVLFVNGPIVGPVYVVVTGFRLKTVGTAGAGGVGGVVTGGTQPFATVQTSITRNPCSMPGDGTGFSIVEEFGQRNP